MRTLARLISSAATGLFLLFWVAANTTAKTTREDAIITLLAVFLAGALMVWWVPIWGQYRSSDD